MTEKELKNIQAPSKSEITARRRKVNTTIFTTLMAIFNLAYTIILVLVIVVGMGYLIKAMNLDFTSESGNEFWGKAIGIISVVGAIVLGLFLNKMLIRAVIKIFNLENKLDKSYVDHAFGRDKKYRTL